VSVSVAVSVHVLANVTASEVGVHDSEVVSEWMTLTGPTSALWPIAATPLMKLRFRPVPVLVTREISPPLRSSVQ